MTLAHNCHYQILTAEITPHGNHKFFSVTKNLLCCVQVMMLFYHLISFVLVLMGFCETKASYQNHGYGKNFKYRKKVPSSKLVAIEYPAFKEFDGECFEKWKLVKTTVIELMCYLKLLTLHTLIAFHITFSIFTIFGVRNRNWD